MDTTSGQVSKTETSDPLKYNRRDAAVIGFGLVLAVLVIGGGVGFINVGRLAYHNQWVAHTHEVIGKLEALLSTLKDAETGERGYLLVKDKKYLEPYEDALVRVKGQVADLKNLTSDNPDQQASIALVEQKIEVRLAQLKQTVDLKMRGDHTAALKMVRSKTSKAAMDELRKHIAAMQQVEHALLEKRDDEASASYWTTVLSILLPAIIGAVLIAVVFYLSQRNISRRQKASAVLAEQKERLRTTLASIGDAVITTDTAGRITNLNPVAESLTGWKNDEATGQPLDVIFRIVNEQTRQSVENPALRALKEGIIVGLANHTVLIAKDNTERPIDDSAAPIRCKQGEIVGCVLVFRDVAERRQTELRLSQSEQWLRLVMDAVPQKIFTANVNGDLDYFNPIWTDFTGLSFEQIKEWGRKQFIHPDDLAETVDTWRHSVETGEPFKFEHRFRRADGEYRWHLSRAKALKDADGKILMWVGSNTDIHEQMHTANELREVAAKLSEADRRKNEFLATLAHELRNPLAPLSNGLQIMQMSGSSEAAVEQARTMMDRQLMHLERLVDDLLDVSRISQGKVELRKEQVELTTVLENAVETSRPLIDAAGHELTVSLPPEPVFVDADVTRLSQVFANLLNNSAKYTEKGGHIWLSAEQRGSTVLVSVKDTGVGIPPDMLPKIFDMFTQIDRSLERSQGGLGIGLTLVKRLVEMHGGSVEARSEGHGMGSEFIVRLPVVLADGPGNETTSSAGRWCGTDSPVCSDVEFWLPTITRTRPTAWRRCSSSRATRFARRTTACRLWTLQRSSGLT